MRGRKGLQQSEKLLQAEPGLAATTQPQVQLPLAREEQRPPDEGAGDLQQPALLRLVRRPEGRPPVRSRVATRRNPRQPRARQARACAAQISRGHRLVQPSGEQEKKFLRNRVRRRALAYAECGASSEVLKWILNGYPLPWAGQKPQPFHQGTSCQNLTEGQSTFMTTELQRFLDVGCLEPAVSARWVTRAFLVPKPGRTDAWRLVSDFRWLNRYLRKQKCRFETLKRLASLARQNDWMISLDLQDGFYAVSIRPEDRPYLTIDIAGFGLFQFAALPMGLSCSPYVFCKVMRTFVQTLRAPLAPSLPGQRHCPQVDNSSGLALDLERGVKERLNRLHPGLRAALREVEREEPAAPRLSALLRRFSALMRRGLRVLPYMDDFLVLATSREEALEARNYVEAVLDLLGLSRNPKKGIWEPSQVLQHLGLGVDTKKGVFFVTPERLDKLQSAARTILGRAARTRSHVPRRQLASFTGLAQSLYLAVPPARFFLRSLHEAVAQGGPWSGYVRLCSAAKTDLAWFASLPARWNGRAIWRNPQTALLHCDASELAWGGVLNNSVPARGFWRAHQRREHITLLELRAVHYTVEAFVQRLAGRHVLLREDNQAVCAILTSWTTKSPEMMKELRRLWWLLDTHNITLLPRYIRSEANVWADRLSRAQDSGDWRLNPAEFRRLDRDWGPHTVDRFATANNAQLPRYNSAWADPRSEGLDAFAQTNWASEHNYCNPPWELLDRLAHLLQDTGAAATVIAPHWPAQMWYQQLQELASEVRLLQPRHDLLFPGRLGSFDAVGPSAWKLACFRVPARLSGTGRSSAGALQLRA